MKWLLVFFSSSLIFINQATAQVVQADTVVQTRDSTVSSVDSRTADSLRHKRIHKTILRSTFVPGWGQITNRQAWKTPLVAAALGFPAYLFFYNLSEYKGLKQAYIYKLDNDTTNDALIPDKYKPLSANSLRFYRDEFRKNVDYSALVFILAWGLNVVDAAVFANLKDFDVSDKLAMRIKPQINIAGQSSVALVFTFKNQKNRPTLFSK